MANNDGRVDILMVEDNANDEALTLHELAKYHLTNRVQVVRDGQEALEYVFCTGRYATRNITDQPNVILLDIKLPSSTAWKCSSGSSRTSEPAPSRWSC